MPAAPHRTGQRPELGRGSNRDRPGALGLEGSLHSFLRVPRTWGGSPALSAQRPRLQTAARLQPRLPPPPTQQPVERKGKRGRKHT